MRRYRVNKPVFTEEMTPEEFRKMTVEMAHWPRAAQEEATRSFIKVLERKVLSGEWRIVDI